MHKNLEDRPLSSERLPLLLDIPIINLSLLTNGDGDEDEDEWRKLDIACKEWGFLQVTMQKWQVVNLILLIYVLTNNNVILSLGRFIQVIFDSSYMY